jgi:transposase
MAKPVVPDDPRAVVAPLLTSEQPKPQGRLPRLLDQAALEGIMFLFATRTVWKRLPMEMAW